MWPTTRRDLTCSASASGPLQLRRSPLIPHEYVHRLRLPLVSLRLRLWDVRPPRRQPRVCLSRLSPRQVPFPGHGRERIRLRLCRLRVSPRTKHRAAPSASARAFRPSSTSLGDLRVRAADARRSSARPAAAPDVRSTFPLRRRGSRALGRNRRHTAETRGRHSRELPSRARELPAHLRVTQREMHAREAALDRFAAKHPFAQAPRALRVDAKPSNRLRLLRSRARRLRIRGDGRRAPRRQRAPCRESTHPRAPGHRHRRHVRRRGNLRRRHAPRGVSLGVRLGVFLAVRSMMRFGAVAGARAAPPVARTTDGTQSDSVHSCIAW